MIPQTDLELFIPHARQGEYFTLPFEVPEATAEMALTYSYKRHTQARHQPAWAKSSAAKRSTPSTWGCSRRMASR